jgi:hypothetical protein
MATDSSNTIPKYYVDIPGVLNIQRDFVNNYSNDPNPDSQQAVANVSTGLNSLYNKILDSNSSAEGILERQEKMKAIVQAESQRLNKKKDDIESAILGKKRAVDLNESYRLRYEQYMKIIIVIIITMVLFIGITFLSKRFPAIPSFVYELVSIAVISVGIFVVYYMTIDMLSRNRTYYNKLNLSGPNADVGNAIVQGSSNSINDLISGTNMKMCIGSSCCDKGSHWDAGNAICIGNTIAAFTTIKQAYSLEKNCNGGDVKPNTPTEFDNYIPV